jgi:hypothetical protein
MSSVILPLSHTEESYALTLAARSIAISPFEAKAEASWDMGERRVGGLRK